MFSHWFPVQNRTKSENSAKCIYFTNLKNVDVGCDKRITLHVYDKYQHFLIISNTFEVDTKKLCYFFVLALRNIEKTEVLNRQINHM